MSGPLKRREVHLIAESLREQGMRVRRTSVGYFFFCPRNGAGTSMHFTDSDVRAIRNFRSRIERWGYQLPPGVLGRRKH